MRKWLVPNPEKMDELQIKAAHHRPSNAIVEVPDHFTRDMEPYITIKEVLHDDGGKHLEPVLDPSYLEGKVKEKNKALEESFAKNKQFIEAQNQIVAKQKFNSYNPIQRAFKNIFGDYADEAQFFLFKQLFSVVFKKEIK